MTRRHFFARTAGAIGAAAVAPLLPVPLLPVPVSATGALTLDRMQLAAERLVIPSRKLYATVHISAEMLRNPPPPWQFDPPELPRL
jgi:hypothetical protein